MAAVVNFSDARAPGVDVPAFLPRSLPPAPSPRPEPKVSLPSFFFSTVVHPSSTMAPGVAEWDAMRYGKRFLGDEFRVRRALQARLSTRCVTGNG